MSICRPGPPKMSLSGLVPGILTNRLALRTCAPRAKEGEEVGDVDIAIVVDVCDVAGIRTPCGEEGQQVGDVDGPFTVDVRQAGCRTRPPHREEDSLLNPVRQDAAQLRKEVNAARSETSNLRFSLRHKEYNPRQRHGVANSGPYRTRTCDLTGVMHPRTQLALVGNHLPISSLRLFLSFANHNKYCFSMAF